MSELRIIPVTFNGKRYIVTDHRMQYDWGQVLYFTDLELPEAFEARFSNAPTGESVSQIGSNNRITVPAQFFLSGEPIYCYITLHDEETDGRTVYTVKIPIKASSDRTEEEPTPVEESVISQAISALNTAVEKTAQDVVSADALVQAASEQADRAEQAADGVEAYVERAESAQQASESAKDRAVEAETSARTSATASAQSAQTSAQIKTDVESMVDDAQASADASYQNAQSAYRYAQDSATSAGQAESYANDASSYASDAQTYSQTASGKASEASQSASTASQKALEASQSASTAVQAKTDAENAKTSAQTAQGLAESARDEAVTAKTDAESARDEAQEIVDDITVRGEQIVSNTERIKSLEDDRYKPYPTDTVSGAVASFTDGADNIPLKSCIVQVEPVQDLHGYDSPWPAGGGVNKFDIDNIDRVGDAYGLTTSIDGDTVRLSGTYEGPDYGASYRIIYHKQPIIADAKFAVFRLDTSSIRTSMRYATDSDNSIVVAINNITANADVDIRFRFMIYTGENAPTVYAPYSNICPISGWEGCVISHSGEDMTNPTTYPITFPTEAGTVYGAYIDPINGELVVTHGIFDLNTVVKNIQHFTSMDLWYSDSLESLGIDLTPSGNSAFTGWCDTYPIVRYGTALFDTDYSMSVRVDGNRKAIYVRTDGTSDVAPIGHAILKLATPIHYPLTSHDVKSLLGQNNIWSDTGNVSVEYRADVTKYINKKITEAVSALT